MEPAITKAGGSKQRTAWSVVRYLQYINVSMWVVVALLRVVHIGTIIHVVKGRNDMTMIQQVL